MSNVTIDGFEIQNAIRGIWIYGSPSNYNNLTISNNNIHNHGDNGILVTDAIVTGLSIKDNSVENSGIGISFANDSTVTNLTVERNQISDNNAGLSLIWGTFSNVTVANCSFAGNAWEHIDLGAWAKYPTFSNVNISGCQFFPGPWCAIYIQPASTPAPDIEINFNEFLLGGGPAWWGVYITSQTTINALYNWWGDVSGPYNPWDSDGLDQVNPDGLGDTVSEYVLYDPWIGQAGMVTGGGWIDSPPGAYYPGHININGTFTGAETARFTGIQCDPNNTPVTFTGTVEVTGIQPNGATMIGLIDQGLYDSGDSAWGSGAYLYLGRIGTNVRIGPSDGFFGGELNQVGANVPYVSGGPNSVDFTMVVYNGDITVTYGGSDYADTYGEIEDANVYDAYPGNEFDSGTYVGLDAYPSDNSVTYDIDISGCTSGPVGKATFGFVAKNKKTQTPDGTTEFQFKAADLNFHSSSYDWLIITGSNYARFKGAGTINGMNAPNGEPYKFMLWGGDGTGTDGKDTFRIKIWYEENNSEIVVYDNGMNQPIGGGNIVVHKSK